MTLTKEERNSPLWMKLKSHLDARLAKLRIENDKSEELLVTEKRRGRIAELKDIIEIGSEKPKPELE